MSQVTTVPLLVVLSAVLVVPVLSSDCSSDGPANCNFEGSPTCGWSVGAGWDTGVEWASDFDNYFLRFHAANRGRVRSRPACSTGGSTHCLTFQFWFQVKNVTDLNVIVSSSDRGEQVVWTVSSSLPDAWTDARVPIRVSTDFSVIIEAKRRDGQSSYSGHVDVDTVLYVKKFCTLYPSRAKPLTTTTPTSTTPSATTTTVPDTTKPTTGIQPGKTTGFDQGERHGQTTVTGQIPTTSEQPLDDILIIIGAVVGGVVVVLFVVILLLVSRSRHPPLRTSHKQRRNHSDVTTSTCNLDLGAQGDATDVTMTTSDGSLDHVGSRHLSDNYYSVIHTTDEDPAQWPANQLHVPGNKRFRLSPGPPRRRTDPCDDSPYEITEDTASIKPPNTSSGPAECSRQLSVTSQDQDGDYNSLDLRGGRRVVERGEGEGEGPGQVYSGFNEGDGDTYSEVTLHRRREVLDDQYSHFQ